jgi:hypothetical protein
VAVVQTQFQFELGTWILIGLARLLILGISLVDELNKIENAEKPV